MHAIVDALAGPGIIAERDASLEVDDAIIGVKGIDDGQRVTPDVAGRDGRGDRPARLLREAYVIARIPDPAFLQFRGHGSGQHLVDPATRHHVAGEKNPRLR